MGKRGPPRLPTEVLIARGSRHAKGRPLSDQPVVIPEGTAAPVAIPEREPPKRPAWLTPQAVKIWDEVIPILKSIGVLTVADGATISRYCQSLVDWVKYDKAIRKEGAWYKHPSGALRAHPAVRLRAECAKVLKESEDRLGLSPQARSSLHLTLAWRPAAPAVPVPTAPKPVAPQATPAPTSTPTLLPIDGERFFKRT